MNNYFFIDAECDGLFGSFISVAVLVADKNGNELEHFYGVVENISGSIETEWVKKNVVPQLENAEIKFSTEYELLEAVWEMWLRYRHNAFAVADVLHPVESRLFAECVKHNPEERKMLSPFPFLDLSSLLFAKGIAWDEDRRSLSGLDIVTHDAMNDVRITAKIFFNLI